jgi:hypothetical protein
VDRFQPKRVKKYEKSHISSCKSPKLNSEPHRAETAHKKTSGMNFRPITSGKSSPEFSSSASKNRIPCHVDLSVRLPTNAVASGNATQDELFIGVQLVPIVDETLSSVTALAERPTRRKRNPSSGIPPLRWILGELVRRPNPPRSGHLGALTRTKGAGQKKHRQELHSTYYKAYGKELPKKQKTREKKKHTAMRDAASCAWVVCAADLL